MTKRSSFFALRPAFLGALACLCLVFTLAQQMSAQSVDVDRAQRTQSQTESPLVQEVAPSGVEGGTAAASPNDADLGEQEILKREERYQAFTVSVGAPFYWTSNVALSRVDERDDFIVAPSAAVYYQPRFTPTFFGLVDVREQIFYYDRFDEFNFGSFDVDVGLTYILPQMDNLILRVTYNYNRLTDDQSFDAFFSNNALIFNAEAPVSLGRAQQLSFGVNANISLAAEPELPRRNDYEAYVGYSANITRAFNINAVGRLVVRDYHDADNRIDLSEIVALSANYSVTKYFTASAISSFAANQSNQNVFDYKVTNLGGAVSLSIKF